MCWMGKPKCLIVWLVISYKLLNFLFFSQVQDWIGWLPPVLITDTAVCKNKRKETRKDEINSLLLKPIYRYNCRTNFKCTPLQSITETLFDKNATMCLCLKGYFWKLVYREKNVKLIFLIVNKIFVTDNFLRHCLLSEKRKLLPKIFIFVVCFFVGLNLFTSKTFVRR